jgi:hypothetical protein
VHLLDGVDQIGQAFERKVFALHGHDDAVRAAQAVEREHGQRRRAIDEHEVVVGLHFGQGRLEALLAPLDVYQLHLGAGQFAVGSQQLVAALFCRHRRLAHRGRFQQHVVHRELELALVHARAHGGIALRVEVDHEHTLADLGQARGQVHGGGGLADAALLVRYAENFGHVFSAFRKRST